MNGERPVGKRHSATVITEKLLESIANASRHFSELAMKEIDAAIGHREFHDATSGHRDFVGCVEYYNRQWAHAVKKKILTPMPPLRRGQDLSANRVGEDLAQDFEKRVSLDLHHLPQTQRVLNVEHSGTLAASGRFDEVICDNCHGLGHMKRVCPSAVRAIDLTNRHSIS